MRLHARACATPQKPNETSTDETTQPTTARYLRPPAMPRHAVHPSPTLVRPFLLCVFSDRSSRFGLGESGGFCLLHRRPAGRLFRREFLIGCPYHNSPRLDVRGSSMNSKLVGIAAEREVYTSLGKRARPAGARASRFKALSHSLRSTARRG